MPSLFPITDFADPALDVYARLTENQLVNREDLSQGLFIAESRSEEHTSELQSRE